MARDVVVKLDDEQIPEILIQLNRKDESAPIVYANLSKFSRLGVDFILDMVQIDPAELQLLVQDVREKGPSSGPPELRGKLVARVLMGPIMVENLKKQAEQILQGVEVVQPKIDSGRDRKVVS